MTECSEVIFTGNPDCLAPSDNSLYLTFLILFLFNAVSFLLVHHFITLTRICQALFLVLCNLAQCVDILNIVAPLCLLQQPPFYEICQHIQQMPGCHAQIFRHFCVTFPIKSVAGGQQDKICQPDFQRINLIVRIIIGVSNGLLTKKQTEMA